MGVIPRATGARWLAVCALALTALPAAAQAAPGDLDPAFGIGGRARIDFGGTDRATHVAVAPDGRIVALGLTDATGGGDFAVARLTAGGLPDPTFGSGGRESLGTAAGVNDIGGGVVVLPAGGIVISGQGNAGNDFVVKQLTSSGGLDPTFGSGGTAVVDFGADDMPNQMVRQSDGKLVLVGSTGSGTQHDFAVARLNADGTPDLGFGTNGRQTVDFGGNDTAYGVAVSSDGKIIVAGQGDPDNEMAIARLNPNGTLDSSFGTGGEVTVDLNGSSAAYAMALAPGGGIVLAGTTSAGGGQFAVARLTASGVLDPSFATTGKEVFGYGGTGEAAAGVAVQADGKIVVMGNAGPGHDFAVTRLSTAGAADASFGSGGTRLVDFGGQEFDGDLALQPDGKIVIAGSTNVHDGGDFAVARLLGDPPASTGGGGGGGTIGGAGSGPQDPTLQLSVTPTSPIAGVRTVFTFVVRQYGSRRSGAYVIFDGARRKVSGSGIAKIATTLDFHKYSASATFPGAPNGSVTITPRYVPRLGFRVSPSRPIIGQLTTFRFFVTLNDRPDRKARVFFDGASRPDKPRRDGHVHHDSPAP